VGLHDETLRRPEEIDTAADERLLGERPRDAMAVADAQRAVLENGLCGGDVVEQSPPSGLPPRCPMPRRVHAAVQPQEAPDGQPPFHGAAIDPERCQLRSGDHAVRGRGDHRDRAVDTTK
jgi:hypothetical protein